MNNLQKLNSRKPKFKMLKLVKNNKLKKKKNRKKKLITKKILKT